MLKLMFNNKCYFGSICVVTVSSLRSSTESRYVSMFDLFLYKFDLFLYMFDISEHISSNSDFIIENFGVSAFENLMKNIWKPKIGLKHLLWKYFS